VRVLRAGVWSLVVATTPWLLRDVPTWACEAILIASATASGVLFGLSVGARHVERRPPGRAVVGTAVVALSAVAVGLELALVVR